MRHRDVTPQHTRRGTLLARLSGRLQPRSGLLLTAAVVLAVMAGAGIVVPTGGGSSVVQTVDAAAFQPVVGHNGRAQRAERPAPACTITLPRPLLALFGHRVRVMLARHFAAHPLCAPGAATSAAAPATSVASQEAATEAPTPASSDSSPAAVPAPAPAPSVTPAPVSGDTAWGSSVMPYGNETYAQAFARTAAQLRPQVIRFFNPGGPSWPSRTGNAPLVISFKLPPRDVIAGRHDAQLAAFFAATPRPTYWTYWHEPEDDRERGAFSPADYRAAWAHIAAIADASGKPLRATLILMAWTAKPASHRTWTDYYAGPEVIDVLAWDAYAQGSGATPEAVYGAARSVSEQAGKPWAIAETGVASSQFSPAARQALLTEMSRYLATSNPRPEFVTYFDSDPDAPNIQYGWNISRDPAAAAAWLAGQAG